MRERRPSVQRCMRTIRVVGLRLLMSFVSNFPFIRELLDHMGIATMSWLSMRQMTSLGRWINQQRQDGFDITIVSGDKDLIQLTDEHTVVEISKKGVAEFEAFTPEYLMEKMGLTPTQFIDLKALMGDKSDNIPGVTKIGEKTGIKLLLEHGSLEGIYENIDGMKASKMKENLIHDKEQAFFVEKHWRPLIPRHRLRLFEGFGLQWSRCGKSWEILR